MSDWNINADPGKIRAAAADTAAIASEMHADARLARPESEAAATGLDGFATAGALRGCLQTAEANHEKLARAMDEVHQNLVATADSIDATEQHATAQFGGTG